MIICTLSSFAQKDVTKFLGIPIDGTKPDMIQKLKAKGFTTYEEGLVGEFNGYKVFLSPVTNNNKVYRIVVAILPSCDETQIRIRFNNLCNQFENNRNYIPAKEKQMIREDEDISYEITIHSKQYQAAFLQDSDPMRSVWFTIHKLDYNEYVLVMYYDNEYNRAQGEDL